MNAPLNPGLSKALYMRRRRAGRCTCCGELGLPPGRYRHPNCEPKQPRRYSFGRVPQVPPPVGKKQCNRCGEMVPADLKHFYAMRSSKDGLQGACKDCERTRFQRGPTYLRYGKHCNVCFGLSHQRDKCGCSGCGKPYAPEAQLDIAAFAFRRESRLAYPGLEEE